MVERVYGTTVIPGDEITVIGGGTIAVSTSFSRDFGLVGAMDSSEGTATPGEVEEVRSVNEAVGLFGENSELTRNIRVAISNGVRVVYAAAVPETDVTNEEFVTSSSGTLANAPILDPSVSPAHEIVVEESGIAVDVEIVYDTPTAPAPDTVQINPITGDWKADASATFEFTYSYGNYSDAIVDVADTEPRLMSVLTHSTDVANEFATELGSNANDFGFTHGLVSAPPELDPSAYSHMMDDPRMSIVAPARAYTDDAKTEQVHTASAVGGHIASLPLGSSSTYDSLSGLTGLAESYTPSQAGGLTDAGVLPVMRDGRILVVKDMTTSTDVRFERIFSNEIVDEASNISHLISQQFIGELNTEENRGDLDESHRTAYSEMVNDRPPLLDDYAITVEQGADPNSVTIRIGLDVVNVIDTIEVTIVVGDVITNGGAA